MSEKPVADDGKVTVGWRVRLTNANGERRFFCDYDEPVTYAERAHALEQAATWPDKAHATLVRIVRRKRVSVEGDAYFIREDGREMRISVAVDYKTAKETLLGRVRITRLGAGK